MGKVYKDKKGSSCKMCKPHKNGWSPKRTNKQTAVDVAHVAEIRKDA